MCLLITFVCVWYSFVFWRSCGIEEVRQKKTCTNTLHSTHTQKIFWCQSNVLKALYMSLLSKILGSWATITEKLTTSRRRCCLFRVPVCPDWADKRSGSLVRVHTGRWGHQWTRGGGGPWSCRRSRILSCISSLEDRTEDKGLEKVFWNYLQSSASPLYGFSEYSSLQLKSWKREKQEDLCTQRNRICVYVLKLMHKKNEDKTNKIKNMKWFVKLVLSPTDAHLSQRKTK